jgi:hypothetical protein
VHPPDAPDVEAASHPRPNYRCGQAEVMPHPLPKGTANTSSPSARTEVAAAVRAAPSVVLQLCSTDHCGRDEQQARTTS